MALPLNHPYTSSYLQLPASPSYLQLPASPLYPLPPPALQRRSGFTGLEVPLPAVVQEYVDHGGRVWKVYVAGEQARCTARVPGVVDVLLPLLLLRLK